MFGGPRGVYGQAAAAGSKIDESTSHTLRRPHCATGRGRGTVTPGGRAFRDGRDDD